MSYVLNLNHHRLKSHILTNDLTLPVNLTIFSLANLTMSETTKISLSDHALLSLDISNVGMTGTSYCKLNDNALQHHAYITSIISGSLQTSHNPNNFTLQHYDHDENKMRDRLRSLCIFFHRQVVHEERYLIAEISKVENQISNNGTDPVLIKELSTLNSQLLTYQNMKAKKKTNQTTCYRLSSWRLKLCKKNSSAHVDKNLTLNQLTYQLVPPHSTLTILIHNQSTQHQIRLLIFPTLITFYNHF